ncbi:MAG: S41 family peptidase [Planctomycetota bacterium]
MPTCRRYRGLLAALAIVSAATAQTGLLRYPDLHGDRVVFTYGGDLWLAPIADGTAVRLTFHGQPVCLLNETSASDGDIFPAMFKRAGLGKLVGKRSWGGIIGITNRGALLDGGTVNVPEFGNTEPGPKWTIEGHGVDPDIVVDNDVQSVLARRDPQLEKGVETLLEQIRNNPRPLPTAPSAPVKTGR